MQIESNIYSITTNGKINYKGNKYKIRKLQALCLALNLGYFWFQNHSYQA